MILKNILPALIITVVMGLLLAASKKKPKQDDLGNLLLQLPKFYYMLGILVILGGIALLIFGFFFANKNDQILAIISSSIALIVGLLLFTKGYISNIRITDSEITETTIFGKTKKIRYNKISDITFGKTSQEIKISSSNKTIKAHIHLVGIDSLISKLEEKTGRTRNQIGIPE
ncbi:hypothetical protein [Tenacibaculum sp. MAR_2009_124]|uniref:hypothetical protein n=1 Tax=Tenacibaculum sp. MAR_2009_124 TaxID=1250059 RepID=UPI00115FC8B8|nr:hypothetical protein [Tenacibaculum sp. MAR_2009_124]